MKKFQVKPLIYHCERAMDYLDELTENQRACIVTDRFMVELGLVDKVTAYLEKRKISYSIFSKVESDPTVETVREGFDHIIDTRPDIMIAIGGGSAIDAAKAIMMFCVRTKEKMNEVVKKPFFIAIPTTSGTGSEVTSYAVVTDTEKDIKIPFSGDVMIPDVAIIDYELTMTMPPSVTADTGMDALTHALEAYVALESSDYTDMFAVKAIENIFGYLTKSFQDGQNTEAREKIHDAACMAGIAFSNSNLGITHSLAHALGAKYHLSHGRVNAILLPYVIFYNSSIGEIGSDFLPIAEKYAKLATYLGIPGRNVKEQVSNLIASLVELNRRLDIPTTLADVGIPRGAFEDNLMDLVEYAGKEQFTALNPRPADAKALEHILKNAYEGIKTL